MSQKAAFFNDLEIKELIDTVNFELPDRGIKVNRCSYFNDGRCNTLEFTGSSYKMNVFAREEGDSSFYEVSINFTHGLRRYNSVKEAIETLLVLEKEGALK